MGVGGVVEACAGSEGEHAAALAQEIVEGFLERRLGFFALALAVDGREVGDDDHVERLEVGDGFDRAERAGVDLKAGGQPVVPGADGVGADADEEDGGALIGRRGRRGEEGAEEGQGGED